MARKTRTTKPKTSTERVAAHRERRRREGDARFQVELRLWPTVRENLEQLVTEGAGPRAEIIREALRLGLAVMLLPRERREAVERFVWGGGA